MWIRQLTAIAFSVGLCLSASAQEGAKAPSSGTGAKTVPLTEEAAKRLRAFVTLIGAACTPELEEQARKGARACALIWYQLDPGQSTTRLPNMLAKTGYRPIVGASFSPDGDPFKTTLRVAHPYSGLVSTNEVTELAHGMTIEYVMAGSETLNFHYTVIGVIFPALCKAYPDKCGMRTYKDRTFDLREYKADTFDQIAPSHSSGIPDQP